MKISNLMTAGIALLILSTIADGLILIVPFLSFPIAKKAIIISILFFLGNVLWWAGVPLVGKELVTRYKKYLHPRSWLFLRKKKIMNDPSASQPPESGTSAAVMPDNISSGKGVVL